MSIQTMTATGGATPAPARAPVRHGVTAATAAAAAGWRRYAAWRARRRDIARLYRFTDRELRDIGLTRADIAQAVMAQPLARPGER